MNLGNITPDTLSNVSNVSKPILHPIVDSTRLYNTATHAGLQSPKGSFRAESPDFDASKALQGLALTSVGSSAALEEPSFTASWSTNEKSRARTAKRRATRKRKSQQAEPLHTDSGAEIALSAGTEDANIGARAVAAQAKFDEKLEMEPQVAEIEVAKDGREAKEKARFAKVKAVWAAQKEALKAEKEEKRKLEAARNDLRL